MSAVSVQQMADRVAQLMEERLRIRGRSLRDKLGRGGRLLPRNVRTSAEYLATASEQVQNPRLATQLDHEKIADAYDACVKYLRPLGSGARRKAAILNLSASISGVAIVTAALVITVLVLRGYL